MSTKTGSVGVTFPDDTVQTTAAIAGAPGFGGSYAQSLKTSPGTYSLPSNTQALKVTIFSAGAGGGGNSPGGYGGAGGGGSGSAGVVVIPRANVLSAYPTGSVPYSVGQGGSSAANGGASSFGTFVSATGGTAGTSATTPSAGTVVSPGGAGGACTTGDFYFGTGSTGGTGSAYSVSPSEQGGAGGVITFGMIKGLPGAGGAVPGAGGNVAGSAGTLWGAGGGGSAKASGGSGAISGGSGSPGIIVIEEHS